MSCEEEKKHPKHPKPVEPEVETLETDPDPAPPKGGHNHPTNPGEPS